MYTSLATTSQALLASDFANLQIFCFILFVGSLAGATTALNFEHVCFIVRILPYCCHFFLTQFSTLGWAHRFNIKFTFHPVRPFYFVRVIFRPQISFLFNPYLTLRVFVHSFALKWLPFFALLGTSAPQLFGLHLPFPNLPPWLVKIWPTLSLRQQLLRLNFVPPHIRFRLIEAQFAAAGIRSQKLKYTNALASLPKHVLRDILNTLDVCNGADEPFDHLKNTLLEQFGKSIWQSYFELPRLPMEVQGLKPSVLMGKLKQHLPTRRGGFCTPGTGGAFTGATDAVPVPSTGTAKEVRPLTSSLSSWGRSSGGALWTPAYIPSRRSDQSDVLQQHWTVHVQCLYLSCYVTVNNQCCRTSRCASFHNTNHI